MRFVLLSMLALGCSGRPIVAGATGDPTTCSTLDEPGCRARTDCHAVFTGELPCDSTACQTHFTFCASGLARCDGPIVCRAQPPNCVGDYTVGKTDSCFEGCVLKSDCAP